MSDDFSPADYQAAADYITTEFLKGGMASKAEGAGLRFSDISDAILPGVARVCHITRELTAAAAEAEKNEAISRIREEMAAAISAASASALSPEDIRAAIASAIDRDFFSGQMRKLTKDLKSLKSASKRVGRMESLSQRGTLPPHFRPYDPGAYELTLSERLPPPHVNGHGYHPPEGSPLLRDPPGDPRAGA